VDHKDAFNGEANKDGDDIGIPVEVLMQLGSDNDGIPDEYSMDESGSLTLHNESEVFKHEKDVDGKDDLPTVDTDTVETEVQGWGK
jgi:hypothetical protein